MKVYWGERDHQSCIINGEGVPGRCLPIFQKPGHPDILLRRATPETAELHLSEIDRACGKIDRGGRSDQTRRFSPKQRGECMRSAESRLAKTPLLLASALLIGSSLFVWPHYYYVAMRIIVCGATVYLIWYCSRTRHRLWALVMAIVAIFFNPFVPIRFSQNPWHAIELVAALLLAISAFGLGSEP
jgi:Family of unknown function (DUF6804)